MNPQASGSGEITDTDLRASVPKKPCYACKSRRWWWRVDRPLGDWLCEVCHPPVETLFVRYSEVCGKEELLLVICAYLPKSRSPRDLDVIFPGLAKV